MMMSTSNPWLSIPLSDYEGHMDAAQQLTALSSLFAQALKICQPESVAVLGIAGGNGLEHLSRAATGITRIVGVDINAQYLDEVRRRFGADLPLELHCIDLARDELRVTRVALVHAGLFFEHAGIARALDNALALVAPGGYLSIVLQLPASNQPGVTATPFASIQTLASNFALIEVSEFRGLLESRRFQLLQEEQLPLPTGKSLWFGIFRKSV
jgi:threonine dehydrogenase-like Zn-dependent dehydrogenase